MPPTVLCVPKCSVEIDRALLGVGPVRSCISSQARSMFPSDYRNSVPGPTLRSRRHPAQTVRPFGFLLCPRNPECHTPYYVVKARALDMTDARDQTSVAKRPS